MSGSTLAAATIGAELSSFTSMAGGLGNEDPFGSGRREFIPSTCAMCVNKCGIIVEVVNNKLHKINPNHRHIKSRGMLCAKGNAGVAIPYNPDRLKRPLLRTGKRGEGKWREISWDEAYKHVAKNLAALKEKYQNRSTVAFASTEGFQEEFFSMLTNAYGSLNTVRHSTLCLSTNIQGWSSVFGVYPDADLKNAQFIIMTGSDRAQALITPDSVDFQRNRPKGQKLVYLDPRFTETAAKADKWFPVKPGTDMAFVLALINVIISEGRYDKKFVQQYTHGFDELVEHVKPYTPEWAEKKCEIPATEIRWVADQFARSAPRSVIYPGRRSSFYANEVYFRRACAILAAICGCWDVEGSVVPKSSIKLASHAPLYPFFMQAEERVDKASVGIVEKIVPSAETYPQIGYGLPTDSCCFLHERDGSWLNFREAILHDEPYPVRGFFVFKQNPIQSVPNTAKTMKMLDKMEFICVIDHQMSDTAWYADLVLPHSTYLERWDPAHSLSGIWPVVAMRRPVIKPLFDTKTMFEMAGGIIHEMLKIPSLWDDTEPEAVDDFKKTVMEEILDRPIQDFIKHQLAGYPGAWEKLQKDGIFYLSDKPRYGQTRKPGYRFKTKTGRIEIINEWYRMKKLDLLPTYHDLPQPETGKYRFLVGRSAWHTHTSTQSIPQLWEIQKENSVWINKREADRMSIKTGDYVLVKSKVGEQKIRAYATEKIRPDCVFYANGWGRHTPGMPLVYKRGGSEAEILEDVLDPISGSAAMHETFVRITKA
jgi:thiosulfate reductase/polysulfide reductase chain A